MILVNTDYINGKELEMLGLVKGSTIQSKNIGRDITQGFKTIVGGELKAYTEMMNEARELATAELNKTYRSELLNRFNGRENILHFRRLAQEVIERIIRREIDKLNNSYQAKGLEIQVADECISHFCVRGARGLPGYIKANIRPIVVNYILENPNAEGIFHAHYHTDKKVFEVSFSKK